jgi:hypothetical protein
LINKELGEVSNWFKANKLSINASKTNYMLLGTPQMVSKKDKSTNDHSTKPEIGITLDDTKLERVEKTKFLGVTIDENLSWKCHIDGISKTISRNIGIINKLKHFIPERILYSLYCTLIIPYVNYGILIWGNTCKTYLEKILKLQKWALRCISNSHYRSHSGPLFAKYNILNVFDTYKIELGIFMFKFHTTQLPLHLHLITSLLNVPLYITIPQGTVAIIIERETKNRFQTIVSGHQVPFFGTPCKKI